MPTRKQRRRRLKDRRHEYEYVYVDEEGNEVDVDEADVEPEPSKRPSRDGRAGAKPKAGSGAGAKGRAAREVQPPSWNRVMKRVLIFAPLMYVLFTITNSRVEVPQRIFFTLLYTLLFIPFMYWMDRLAYRRYLQRTGQAEKPRPNPAGWFWRR